MTTAKNPEIFLEEKKSKVNKLSCPYCKKNIDNEQFLESYFGKSIFHYQTNSVTNRCIFCCKKFNLRLEAVFYTVKDCELNGEEHDFKSELIGYEFRHPSWSIHRQIDVKEICTKCEAQRCSL